MRAIMHFKFLCIFISFFIISSPIDADDSAAQVTKEEEQKKVFDPKDLDTFVETLLKCRNIPSAMVSMVQLNDDDQVVLEHTKGYGIVDPACESKCDNVDLNTKFCIGSVSKGFTAGVIGKLLLDSKKFKDTLWDTTLKGLLPCDQRDFFKGDPIVEKITVRDLLAHRMGLPRSDFAWFMGTNTPRTEIWKNIFRMESEHAVSLKWRSSFMYSNWMYALAGHITELMSNTTWEKLVQKYYFTPLNMKSSTFTQDAPANWAKFAKFGILRQDKWVSSNEIMNLLKNPSAVAPAGAICTTSVDMNQYMKFLLTNSSGDEGGVPREIIMDTFEPSNYYPESDNVIHKPKFPVYVGTHTYGMGWGQGVYREYRSLAHAGGIYGFKSDIILLPDIKLGVFVSTAGDAITEKSFSAIIAHHVLDLVLGEKPWIDIDSACTVYPEAFSLVNQSDSFGSDNQTNYEYVCDGLVDEFSKFEGIYQSSVSGTLYVIPNKDDGFLEFKLGVSGRGRLCRTSPPVDDLPNALRFYFEGVFEHYNTPALNSKLNATVIFHPPKGAGEVPSATLGFLENSVYHWIGPIPPPPTVMIMPAALQPFAGPSDGRSRSANIFSSNIFFFNLIMFTFCCFFGFFSTC